MITIDPQSSSATSRIQSAIERAHQAGGGMVRLEPGEHLSGTLRLLSGVHLHLAPGAVLLGSEDPNDYTDAPGSFVDAVGSDRGRSLILAHDAEDVGISGPGTINGRGGCFSGHRPMLLRFIHCRRVTVRDVRLRDSAAWVQHYLTCEDVHVTGVRVDSHANGNNDGINLDGCARVRVSDCHFDCGDDAFTLKCTTETPCRDVVVTNCLFSSECNGIKFGTESIGGFENVHISNCVVMDTALCGITVASVDGAFLRDVTLSQISMRNVGCALFMRLGARGYHLPPEHSPRPLGSLERVTLRDISAEVRGPEGSAVLGHPDRPIRDLLIENFHARHPGGADAADAAREVPELSGEYPQYDKWGMLPAHTLYCRHVDGLTLRNVRGEPREPDARPDILLHNTSLKID
ncbi:MAG: hypothetical protein JJU05_09805 [Verrucomicrobia bacterium]|nr:hypothetical protein [Verrucomicrobiota bacterium]MCH8527557.1 hypothetical protein [Kiritimatiellia bacterium]